MTNNDLNHEINDAIKRITDSSQPLDMLIIGGGITGAGIFQQAARAGLRVLLVEQQDYAWGTSSRSSKLVHGGLRYLAEGQIAMTRDSVNIRETLLKQAPGLVKPLSFIMPHYSRTFPGPWVFNRLLDIYDWLAGNRQHRFYKPEILQTLLPPIESEKTLGGTQFHDAITDDSRLVLRLIAEGKKAGGTALNYCTAEDIKQEQAHWSVLIACSEEQDKETVIKTSTVINATGVWVNKLRKVPDKHSAIRPLRGSHLVLPFWKLPLSHSVTLPHPEDNRPIYAYPWSGVTVLGTTDLDHHSSLNKEPSISTEEVDYLLSAAQKLFPKQALQKQDILSTWAGIRPVISSGKGLAPSREKREHSLWNDNGLISISGGKLTTFHQIAREVLAVFYKQYPDKRIQNDSDQPIFRHVPLKHHWYRKTGEELAQWLEGCYGKGAETVLLQAHDQEIERIYNTNWLWCQLRWALKHEQVKHLDDLLLRRTRLGLTLPFGGKRLLPQLENLFKEELNWTKDRWQQEKNRYQTIWSRNYSVPA